MAVLYLDVDDEITSAAARIRAIDEDRIAVVLPFGSRLATSRMNFKLLAHEATSHGTGGRSLDELSTLRVNPSVPMRLLPDFHPTHAAAPEASPPVAAASDTLSPGARPSRAWVPIRSLGPRHRERITAHLVALNERSRYLRFGYAANDAQIRRYVDTLDFEHDEVFGDRKSVV